MPKKDRQIFPHIGVGSLTPGERSLHPIQEYNIRGRTLCLYSVEGRPPSACFSLYWEDETVPVQHAMTCIEVFNVLSGLLKKSQKPRKRK